MSQIGSNPNAQLANIMRGAQSAQANGPEQTAESKLSDVRSQGPTKENTAAGTGAGSVRAESSFLSKLSDKISSFFQNIGSSIKDFISGLTSNSSSSTAASSAAKDAAPATSSHFLAQNDAIKDILQNDPEAMTEKGIFRTAGNVNEMKVLRSMDLTAGFKDIADLKEQPGLGFVETKEVAGAFKANFRDGMIADAGSDEMAVLKDAFTNFKDSGNGSLPSLRQTPLPFQQMIKMFAEVTLFSDRNLMTPTNLGVCVSPSVTTVLSDASEMPTNPTAAAHYVKAEAASMSEMIAAFISREAGVETPAPAGGGTPAVNDGPVETRVDANHISINDDIYATVGSKKPSVDDNHISVNGDIYATVNKNRSTEEQAPAAPARNSSLDRSAEQAREIEIENEDIFGTFQGPNTRR